LVRQRFLRKKPGLRLIFPKPRNRGPRSAVVLPRLGSAGPTGGRGGPVIGHLERRAGFWPGCLCDTATPFAGRLGKNDRSGPREGVKKKPGPVGGI